MAIWKIKNCHVFHFAVDPVKQGISDYFDIVKKPMDFSLIKKKLLANVYANP